MRDYNSQKIEIETIKPRAITVNLSSIGVKRPAKKSGEGGLTISELLENFIEDLVDGTYSNGSDERMYAKQWYQRCWFAMFSDNTLLKFLLLWGDLDDYIDLMDELESNKKEMAKMTTNAEGYPAEERDELQEYIDELQKEIDCYWDKFLEQRRQEESYVFGKEIENVIAWESQLDTILDPENPQQHIISEQGENVPIPSYLHIVSMGKLYPLVVHYSPYTCNNKHRRNVPARIILPLVSRCTGATPPDTPTCAILQNGKMTVP